MAKATAEAPDTAPVSGADVEVIEFNGLSIPVTADFVSPGVTRHVEFEVDQTPMVCMFVADEPRKLPPYAIVPCLAQGIQLVK